MYTIISDPEIKIDGDIFGQVPNSVSIMSGSGEQSVVAKSIGGGATRAVLSSNVESNISTVKFEAWSDFDSVSRIESFKNRAGRMLITVSGRDSDGNVLSYAFRNMTLITHPEVMLQNEGKVSLEFKGERAS